jgi:hypothetical protein
MGKNKKCFSDENFQPLMVWDVPKKTKEDFKSSCEKQGRSMKEVLISFMNRFTKRG